jgi:release factor glutamine methyltransferase
VDPTALKALLRRLSGLGYRFTTVTPETHARVNARPGAERAHSLRDVFGWNRPFFPEILQADLFESMQAAGVCVPSDDGCWRATIRVASFGHLLFAHSSYPTDEKDAVFFGPDSSRFARAVQKLGADATRAVDIGCGSGVGGIVLSHFGALAAPVVLADINPVALTLAGINAELANVSAEVVSSDVLRGVAGSVDLVIANPPYLIDAAARAYRHGGDASGCELSTRIVKESLARLDRDGGGSLLVYTGVAMIEGADPFFRSVHYELQQSGVRYSYEELDPDVFSSELAAPAYARAERIAVVLLHATLGGSQAAPAAHG